MTQTKPICLWLRTMACLGLSLGLMLSNQTSTAGEPDALRQTSTVRAIKRAEPSVVNIEGNKPSGSTRAGESQQVNGMGAGVIIDRRGYILTNQHVVQDVGRIEVTLSNGRQYIGRMIDRDTDTDLALVKIDAGRPLPVIECGTSSDLMLGEPVIAIGNPYGYHHTVTMGIVSALKRDIPVNGVQEYPDLIQTDASINPGNSGGPLLNATGSMIGINAAVRIGAQGIGFAIPVDRATEVAAVMIARHRSRVSSFESPIRVRTNFRDGVSFVSVTGSQVAGLKTGDVITAINNSPIYNTLDFELSLLDQSSGSKLEIDGKRSGSAVATTVTLGDSPSGQVQLASTNTTARNVYNEFGFRLELADSQKVRSSDSSYSGGFQVVSVRENSPAANAQIQPGDILVGLLEWQTPHWKDLGWILNRSELKNSRHVKFHIMRGNDVFWGTLDR